MKFVVKMMDPISGNQSLNENMTNCAYLTIVEQPLSKIRFRYECEGRTAGTLLGESTTNISKTYPTVKIVNYVGDALILVSCVSDLPPFRQHPHQLICKNEKLCKNGALYIPIVYETNKSMVISLENVGIQCVKRKYVADALNKRKLNRIDPFKAGFDHATNSNLNPNAIRLCFQAILYPRGLKSDSDTISGDKIGLKPVVSNIIFDKKTTPELKICAICSCESTVHGGKTIFLNCDKVCKDDVKVRFFEEVDGKTIWESFGEFSSLDIHHNVSIKFRTPKYRNVDIQEPVTVQLQLIRPSTCSSGKSIDFIFSPNVDQDILRRKRKRVLESLQQIDETNTPELNALVEVMSNFQTPQVVDNSNMGNDNSFPQDLALVFNDCHLNMNSDEFKVALADILQ